MNEITYPTYRAYINARRKSLSNKLEFLCRTDEELVTYLKNMVNAIAEELQQREHCWLIDFALANGTIHSVDWAAIEAGYTVLKQVEHKQNLSLPIPRVVPVDAEMEKKMLEMYQNPSLTIETANLQSTRDSLVAERDILYRELEGAKCAKATLLDGIKHLETDMQRLHDERQKVEQNVQKRLDDATAEAEDIVRRAHEKADGIRTALLHGIASEDAKTASPVQPSDYISKDDVEEKTRHLENTIRISLESYRDELYRTLYEFRTGMYKMDYSDLCFAYQKLYHFITNVFDKRIEALCENIDDEEMSASIQLNLRKVQGQLLKRLTAMEEGLAKLGLTIYRPEQGEDYHASYHVAENAEDDGYLEAKVVNCVCPGIRINEQVLCPASVVVNAVENA